MLEILIKLLYTGSHKALNCLVFPCSRAIFEERHNTMEDLALTGLLKLCTAVMKHNPPFKFSKEGQVGICHLFTHSPKRDFVNCRASVVGFTRASCHCSSLKHSYVIYPIYGSQELKTQLCDTHSVWNEITSYISQASCCT